MLPGTPAKTLTAWRYWKFFCFSNHRSSRLGNSQQNALIQDKGTDQMEKKSGAKMARRGARRTTAIVLAGCTVKPQPMTDDERLAEIVADRAAMFSGQEPLAGPLTLDQAFARALKYNLDERTKVMEEAIANNQLDLANFDLLPKITAGAGYTNRTNDNAASSESILTHTQSLEPSISTDRNDFIPGSLTGSWNVLDFGVSYYAARQQANRTLIAQEQRRKVLDNLFEEVRTSFWRVAGAQAMSAEILRIEKEAEQALTESRSGRTAAAGCSTRGHALTSRPCSAYCVSLIF